MVFAKSLVMTIFFLSLFAPQAHAKVLLSYEQFLALSDNQKLSYISRARELAVALSRNPELVSAEDIKLRNSVLKNLLQGFIQSAEAGEYDNTDRVCEMKNAKNLTNEELLSAFGQTLNCTEIQSEKGDPVYFRPVAIERVEVIAAEFFSRVDSKAIGPNTKYYYDGIGALQAAISEIKKNGTRSGKVNSSWMSSANSQLSQLQRRTTKTGKLKSQPTQINKKIESSKSPSSQIDASLKPATPALALQYQCLYAGFVIPKSSNNRCQPYQKLPFDSEFFNEESFVCPEASQILCNPLLFGFEETECQSSGPQICAGKKPICVFRSQDATQNCFKQAKLKKTLKQTLEIWKSKEGESLYRKYVESLEELCDTKNLEQRKMKAKAFQNINKTCSVAFSVLKEQIRNEFLPDNLLSPTPEKNSGNR